MGSNDQSAALARAARIEAAILECTTALGEELRKPFSARSPAAVREKWDATEALRPALNRALRDVRKAEDAVADARVDLETRELKAARRQRKYMDRRSRMWDKMHSLVEQHIAPQRVELLPEDIPLVADPLTELLARILHRVANPVSQAADASAYGCFTDIPLPVTMFQALALAAYRLMLARGGARGARFCDIGCGGGTKLIIARRYFRQAVGIEYDGGYADAARDFVKRVGDDSISIVQANGITYDGYGDFDVIYYFRPVVNPDLLADLDRQVCATAAPGTLILAPHDHFLAQREGFPAQKIAGCIYTVGLTKAEIETWRKDAEHTDLHPVTRPENLAHDIGYWSPILRAATFDFLRT